MRKTITSMVGLFALAVLTAGCETVTNHDMCAWYYGFEPESADYKDCMEHDGVSFMDRAPKME